MTFCALLLLRRIQLVKENYLEIGYTRGGKAYREGFKRVQTCIPPVIIPHIDPFCIKVPSISCTLRTQLTKLYQYTVWCVQLHPRVRQLVGEAGRFLLSVTNNGKIDRNRC